MSKFRKPSKIVAGIVAGATAIMSGIAAAADGTVTTALTAGIDKTDLAAGGAIILGACAVVAMVNMGRKVAR
ncbi:hypothetical protein [Xanthomonas sacchari]|uniref:Methyltransferase n=1 Tax=Xanthomonas sacchari TaxID=56458 RepID=A0A2P5Z516_9XANT|nr:hypothetical protein [Xanthomonas sacchari]MDV0438275.1 hypothetical protein [Xanthomonas sacchari]PPU83066.1 hypothetical protein XsacCFBP4641_07760 [Xanthomonas sacchari]